MDVRTGRIVLPEFLDQIPVADRPYMREMQLPPTAKQLADGKVGRNHPCPCGSGKKFKRCCLIGGKAQ